ncbi:MAG: efflux RND transporter periplasmic adaptor subunit, partial [Planctomycetota bacterium]
AVAGQHYYSALAPAASAVSSDGHEHAHDDQTGHTLDDQAGHSQDGQVEYAHDEAQPEPDLLSRYDVEIQTVGSGVLELQTKLAGEVKLNADRVAHVVPQVAGKVREVLKGEGSMVKAGEVMGWIESAALGQAKIDYLSKFAEISCCTIELTRAREVYENANRLLEVLESSPSLESLSDTDWGPMGKVRSDLVSAYAELQYTRAAYEREKRLFEKKIASGDEFQKAESNLKKAEALYHATRDRVAFEVQHDLLEATRAQQIRELDVAGAERNLYVLGLTAADVRALQRLTASSGADQGATVCTDPNCPTCVKARANAAGQLAALESEHSHGEAEHVCTDPNCTDCAEHAHEPHVEQKVADPVRASERLAWYPMRAPFDGTVISKHLALGESVKDDAEVFVIADLSTVWVDFRVHQRDLPSVMSGQTVVVDYGQGQTEGVITYIAPVVGDDTRTALARVVVPNPSGSLRPGTFVTGTVAIDREKKAMVIGRSAVQYIDDQPCVFVYDGHAFDKRKVTLGRTDGKQIEVTEGLKPAEKVVTKNAFRIKAELEKSKTALGGHGHVH